MIGSPEGSLETSAPPPGHRAEPARSRRRSVIIWTAQGILVAIGLATVAWAFGLLGGKPKSQPINPASARPVLSVSTDDVVEGSIVGRVHLTGTVQSADPREVTPATSGKLMGLPIREGTKVRAGQVVARLADVDGALALNVAAATSNLAKTRQELDRLEHPVADSLQVAQARASVETAQENLDVARRKRDEAERDYDEAKRTYDRAKRDAEASASRSSAAASRAAASSQAAAASSRAAATSQPPATQTTSQPTNQPTSQPTVTVTVTAKPTKPTATPTGAMLGAALGVRLAAELDDDKPDLTTATSDLASAKARRESARDAVVQAETNLHAAQRTLDAYNHIDPAAQAQIVETRRQVDAAQLQYDVATRNLAALTVTAPIAGTVTSVPVVVGASITPATVVARIDSGGFEAKASVEPAVAAALQSHPASPVAVTGGGLPRITAKVRTVSPTTDTASDRTSVTFSLLPPRKTVVRAGATVAVDVTLPAARGLVLPASSVVGDGNQTVVYLLDPGSLTSATTDPPTAKVRRVVVTLVTADADHALVTGDGLEVGSKVVVVGQTQLADGAEVTVLPREASSATRSDSAAAAATPAGSTS